MDTKIKILLGSSVLLLELIFTSAFIGSYKLMALGFTQYIIMLVYIMAQTSFKNFSIADFLSLQKKNQRKILKIKNI